MVASANEFDFRAPRLTRYSVIWIVPVFALVIVKAHAPFNVLIAAIGIFGVSQLLAYRIQISDTELVIRSFPWVEQHVPLNQIIAAEDDSPIRVRTLNRSYKIWFVPESELEKVKSALTCSRPGQRV